MLVALALVLSQHALAGDVPLSTRLASALAVRGNSWATSAALAVDLQSDGVVFARNADLSLAPASNEKLPVTFAALKQLGLSYRFKTEVLGRGTQDGTVWRGDLFLKGFGDPTLTSARLGRLAETIAASGITRIDGRLYGDESWFDARRAAPGWKLGYLLYECPPLSALVVDRAVYDGHTALNPALAAAVSIALCSIAIFLGYLALRARRSALLTGVDRLVGQVGVARTEISSQGTVLVRGEYWQARSNVPIPPGSRVSIERVQDMTLYVKEA